jgi:hypothetical protein
MNPYDLDHTILRHLIPSEPTIKSTTMWAQRIALRRRHLSILGCGMEAPVLRLKEAGFEATSILERGEPDDVIASQVESSAVGLLVMGAYGHSRIRRLVIDHYRTGAPLQDTGVDVQIRADGTSLFVPRFYPPPPGTGVGSTRLIVR